MLQFEQVDLHILYHILEFALSYFKNLKSAEMAQLNHKKISRSMLKVGEMIERFGVERVSGGSHKAKDGMIPPSGLLVPDMSIVKKNLEPLISRGSPSGSVSHRRTSRQASRSR